jgi:signal transduction histidine kinase
VTFLRRLIPATITAQITSLVIAAVLLGVGLASAVLFYLIYEGQTGPNAEAWAANRAAHVAAVVREAEAVKSTMDLEQVLKRAQGHGIDVRTIPISQTNPRGEAENSSFMRAVDTNLRETWGISPLFEAHGNYLAVKIGSDSALRFKIFSHGNLHNIVLGQTICALAIITFIILFLSIYAVRWVTRPLSSIASAARSFGHVGAEEDVLLAGGPLEIAQVSEALNDMRKRVRTLVDERTHMLVAISHDLRTPLTRLRLRAERLSEEVLRENMLSDIATVNDMLGETLMYLRDGGRSEPAQLVDLPSLLQTICAQFSDVGQDVVYQGPNRQTFACRAQALMRAVTNVVDNGTKHGSSVTVALSVEDRLVHIEVTDDGPGIPASLRSDVFEPFFKGDIARSPQGRPGFGLGLSIARDIVRRHGGEIELLDSAPRGLKVRLSIKEIAEVQTWGARDVATA